MRVINGGRGPSFKERANHPPTDLDEKEKANLKDKMEKVLIDFGKKLAGPSTDSIDKPRHSKRFLIGRVTNRLSKDFGNLVVREKGFLAFWEQAFGLISFKKLTKQGHDIADVFECTDLEFQSTLGETGTGDNPTLIARAASNIATRVLYKRMGRLETICVRDEDKGNEVDAAEATLYRAFNQYKPGEFKGDLVGIDVPYLLSMIHKLEISEKQAQHMRDRRMSTDLDNWALDLNRSVDGGETSDPSTPPGSIPGTPEGSRPPTPRGSAAAEPLFIADDALGEMEKLLSDGDLKNNEENRERFNALKMQLENYPQENRLTQGQGQRLGEILYAFDKLIPDSTEEQHDPAQQEVSFLQNHIRLQRITSQQMTAVIESLKNLEKLSELSGDQLEVLRNLRAALGSKELEGTHQLKQATDIIDSILEKNRI